MHFIPTGILIGPLYLHYYGMIILMGVLAGTWLASQAGKKYHWVFDTYMDMLPWALILGILGARLWHVLIPSVSSGITLQYYLKHPVEILEVWNGGLGIPGGILGGALGIAQYCRRYKISFPCFIDTIGIGLPLGQAIGRWGNFVNQELYGLPSDLPWAITIDPVNRIAEYADVATYHPLFLYESLYNLIVTFILWKLFHRKKAFQPGSIFTLYLVLYPLGRFFLEYLRLDKGMAGGLNVNQYVMGVTAIVALIIFLARNGKKHGN